MMMDINGNVSSLPRGILHQGWVEQKLFHEYKWRRVWLALQGNYLMFYKAPNTGESPTGCLTIKSDLKFDKKSGGSEKAGYKFEIHTDRKICKFKAWKFSDREMWRAYLEGIATGVVSNTIDLPPELLVQIRVEMEIHFSKGRNHLQQHDRTSLPSPRNEIPSSPTQAQCADTISTDSGLFDDAYLEPTSSILQTYRFYNDPHRKDLPSWFFLNCSRERAEEILSKANRYGNTLMRKGPTSQSKLVISKKLEIRREEFSHYVVVVHTEGYKLQVENIHQPMKTLTEVMDFFVVTSGPQSTKPMSCNSLQELGISPEHDYNPVIIQNSQSTSLKHSYVNNSPRQTKAQTWSKSKSLSLAEQQPVSVPHMDFSKRLSLLTESQKSSTSIPRVSIDTRQLERNKARTSPSPPSTPVPLPPRPSTNLETSSSRINAPRTLPRKLLLPTAPNPVKKDDGFMRSEGTTDNFKKELELRLSANKHHRLSLPVHFTSPNLSLASTAPQKQEEDIYDDIECYQQEESQHTLC